MNSKERIEGNINTNKEKNIIYSKPKVTPQNILIMHNIDRNHSYRRSSIKIKRQCKESKKQDVIVLRNN